MSGYAVVILAGGAGRRMAAVGESGSVGGPGSAGESGSVGELDGAGGPGAAGVELVKPMLRAGGRPMIERVLAAVPDARPRIVAGPAELALPGDVVRVLEDPPGGGPVAAAAAGLAALYPAGPIRSGPIRSGPARTAWHESGRDSAGPELVALLAADLPLLSRAAVGTLLGTLAVDPALDGAVYLDEHGRRQVLCGVWRAEALRRRLAALPTHIGAPIRELLSGLRIGEVSVAVGEPPPWYDCDAPADLRRAEGWL